MCGINGLVSFGNKHIAWQNILAMNTAIAHRGQDDEGFFAANTFLKKHTTNHLDEHKYNLYFGFQRLAIQDLSNNAHQPMLNKEQTLVLVFNGEIYNFLTLKKELETLGYTFRSNSDSEVVLYAYQEWHKDCLEKLEGMFAFAIYDLQKNIIFAARDHIGMKPLFFTKTNDYFIFSSEIKGLLAAGLHQAEINFEGLWHNFSLSVAPHPLTCFKDIEALPHGHYLYLEIETKKLHVQQYWDIPIGKINHNLTPQEVQAKTEELLKNSVKTHLRADVPVGILLSGGIDSSLIAALAKKELPEIQAFTLAFDENFTEFNEYQQALANAQKHNITQHIKQVKFDDVAANLQHILEHFEEPYNNLEAALTASAFVKEHHIKVLLNGLGGDENFGGYHYYQKLAKWHYFQKIAFLKHFIPPIHHFTKRLKNYLELQNIVYFYVNFRDFIKHNEKQQLFADYRFEKTPEFLNRLYQIDKKPFEDDIEKLGYLDLKYYIGNHHVYRDDLSTMLFGIEGRYPFLDKQLIEFAATIPHHIKYSTQNNKPILRAIAQKYLAPQSLNMSKKGFGLPLNYWLKKELKQFAFEAIQALKKRHIFNTNAINKILVNSNEPYAYSKIWQLVSTEYWLRKYFSI